MKNLIIGIFIVLVSTSASAQKSNSPRTYYNRFNKELNLIQEKSMEYFKYNLTEADHKQVDGRLEAITRQLEVSKKRLSNAPPYKDDSELQQSYLVEMDSLLLIFEKDFKEIQNLKRFRNESYEALFKYYTALGEAEERMRKAEKRLIDAEESFAKRNSITLKYNSEEDEKYQKFVQINDHVRAITLLFFKTDQQIESFSKLINNNPNKNLSEFGLEEIIVNIQASVKTSIDELEDLEKGDLNNNLQKEAMAYLKELDRDLKKTLSKIGTTLAIQPYYSNEYRDARVDLKFFMDDYQLDRKKFLDIRLNWLENSFSKL